MHIPFRITDVAIPIHVKHHRACQSSIPTKKVVSTHKKVDQAPKNGVKRVMLLFMSNDFQVKVFRAVYIHLANAGISRISQEGLNLP